MYDFAIVVMLSLALVKVVDFIVDQADGLERVRSLFTFVGGIGAVLVMDYSLFRSWAIDIRSDWMGVWATGLILVGGTVLWRAAFSYLTHHRSPIDEPLGDHHPILERAS